MILGFMKLFDLLLVGNTINTPLITRVKGLWSYLTYLLGCMFDTPLNTATWEGVAYDHNVFTSYYLGFDFILPTALGLVFGGILSVILVKLIIKVVSLGSIKM